LESAVWAGFSVRGSRKAGVMLGLSPAAFNLPPYESMDFVSKGTLDKSIFRKYESVRTPKHWDGPMSY
jgi:hypothetical protein